MAGKRTDTPGKKLSVWVSGENQQRLAEQGLSPGEALARGLESQDRVPVPPEAREALRWLSRLAEAAANGMQMTAPGHLEDFTLGEPPGALVVPSWGDRPLTRSEEAAWLAGQEDAYKEQEGYYRLPVRLAEEVMEVLTTMTADEIPPGLKHLGDWLHHGDYGRD